jgi:hypothetical protein
MFERQCYIVKKVSNDEAKKVSYEWGLRAHKEIGKRAIFKNFCSVSKLKFINLFYYHISSGAYTGIISRIRIIQE